MCGILAHINCTSSFSQEQIQSILSKRGADFFSFTQTANAIFYHALLALTDEIEHSIQPLESEQLIVLLNGEIYNHLELRKDLITHHSFKTQTDSETLLIGFQTLGKAFLQHLRGMFALIIHDKINKQTFIFRDGFGIKPLYYLPQKNELTICSSLDYFKNIPVNKKQQQTILTWGWSLKNQTLFDNVKQFPKGQLGVFNSITGDFTFEKIVALTSKKTELFESIKTSVKEQCKSPYPTGILFSGGIDSSVLAVATKELGLNLPLYTFDFKGNQEKYGFSEDLTYAKKIASELNLELRIVTYKESDFAEYVEVHRTFSEPYLDLAGFSLHLLCKQAKKDGIKILLNGTGADEFFGGYRRHMLAKTLNFVPRFLQKTALKSIITKQFPPVTRLEKKVLQPYCSSNFLQTLLCYDQNEYLENNNLKYTDGIGLYHGIEIRVPLLSPQIVTYGLDELKNNRIGKPALKDILYKHLPKELVNRPKSGFALPIQFFKRKKRALRKQLLTNWLNKSS